MTARVKFDDDTAIGVEDDGQPRPRGCQWDESVCMESPTHRVVPPEHNLHHDSPEVFCARHYALALARLVIVHLPGCSAGVRQHIVEYGAAGEETRVR